MRLRSDLVMSLLVMFILANVVEVFAQQPSEAPAELVRRSVQNEIQANNNNKKFTFRERKESPAGSQTELMVQTREAMAGILIANNDHPLNDEQRQAENARVGRFAKDPEELNRRRASEQENRDRITKIVKALPDAFLYESDGVEMGDQGVGGPGKQLIRLKFKPNPKYNPPSRVEQVLTGMQGHVLIDAKQGRIATIDGTLAEKVGFGWGILGHLDPGGHFLVNQADVHLGDWEVTRIEVDITGKVLFFRTLSFKSKKTYSDFHLAPPNLSFAEGVEFLKKQVSMQAQNSH